MTHWHEADHPRDERGRFTEDWAGRLSAVIARGVPGPIGRWQEGSPREAYQEMRDRMVALFRGADPNASDDEIDRALHAVLVGGQVPVPMRVYRSGEHRIVVATDKKVPVERIQQIIADLQVANPSREPVNLWVVPRTHMMIPNAAAESIRGTGFIRLADDAWNERHFRKMVEHDPGYFMPQAVEHDSLEYYLAHEWGHVVDYSDVPGGDAKTQEDLKRRVNPHLSEYGWNSTAEAFAESFAEWYLSRGQTENDAAIAYADMYQWRA